MTKHTPGPWRAAFEGRTASITSADGCCYIAEMTELSWQGRPLEEEVANALLIAAAPDLLAALERQLDEHKRTWLTARAEVEGEGVSACLFEAEPATIAARAAIKKARGGA